jgi:two-component system cell cycle sensor histidine kinase/response regulator CckA
MTKPLRILHLEDDRQDSELVAGCLRAGGMDCRIERVDDRDSFEREVRSGNYHVILSDFKLPAYDGAAALTFAREHRPDIPFILVSGAVGEEAAVGCLVGGATDYVLKGHLSHLIPSLQRALRESEDRQARQRAEEALLLSEQRYRRLFEAAKDGILLLDAVSGRILDANPSVLELLGYSAEKVLGRTPEEVGICGNDAATHAAFAELTSREYVRLSGVRLFAVSGQFVDVEFVGSGYEVDEQRIIQVNVRDISERRRLENDLRQSQKLEAVGRLAGGVAHDFNNMLTVINSYTELALKSLPADHPLQSDLEEVRKAGIRAARLTGQLLAFSRKQIMKLVICSPNSVIVDIERMLRRVIGEDVELVLQLAPDLGNVLADPGQLEQVLMNLIVNARDAIERGGTITIATFNSEIGPDVAHARSDLRPGPYVTLSVSDTGSGMDDATVGRMFEPFFTTKSQGKGTGLGLPTVYGIVKQSGGFIDVESEVGKGTTIRIHLPRQQGQAVGVEAAPPTTEGPARADETILLVEDDASVRRLVHRVLSQRGYRVLSARSATEALSLAANHNDPIALLLTDVVLPGMDGCDLARSLVAARPMLKVIYMSGYTAEAVLHLGPTEGRATLIEKPFAVAELLRRIRSVLGSGAVPAAHDGALGKLK